MKELTVKFSFEVTVKDCEISKELKKEIKRVYEKETNGQAPSLDYINFIMDLFEHNQKHDISAEILKLEQ